MKHPLTDEMCEGICEQVSQDCDWHATQNEIWSQTLRAAADWQLEQVIQFLEANTDLSVETALRFIRPAMRPKEES